MKSLALILIAAALSIASVVVIAHDGQDAASSAPETATLWKCRSCHDEFSLTAQEVLDLAHGPYNGAKPLPCPHCGKPEAFLAHRCRACNTVFLGSEVEGGTLQCPHCTESPLKTFNRVPGFKEQRQEDTSPPPPPAKVI